jgi:hypothetical protein
MESVWSNSRCVLYFCYCLLDCFLFVEGKYYLLMTLNRCSWWLSELTKRPPSSCPDLSRFQLAESAGTHQDRGGTPTIPPAQPAHPAPAPTGTAAHWRSRMIMMCDDEQPRTLKEAAELYYLTVSTLRTEASRGWLEVFRIGKRDYAGNGAKMPRKRPAPRLYLDGLAST